jgi:hypothetical protein
MNRLSVSADLLRDGYEPNEVTLLAIVDRVVRDLVNREVAFGLSAANLDRPDAAKYGTHPDGSPCHAPEWYVAQGISTGIHEGLYGALKSVLGCESVSESGRECIGSIMHETLHWDGHGLNWGGSTNG